MGVVGERGAARGMGAVRERGAVPDEKGDVWAGAFLPRFPLAFGCGVPGRSSDAQKGRGALREHPCQVFPQGAPPLLWASGPLSR